MVVHCARFPNTRGDLQAKLLEQVSAFRVCGCACAESRLSFTISNVVFGIICKHYFHSTRFCAIPKSGFPPLLLLLSLVGSL